jgi:hypothetical protein
MSHVVKQVDHAIQLEMVRAAKKSSEAVEIGTPFGLEFVYKVDRASGHAPRTLTDRACDCGIKAR